MILPKNLCKNLYLSVNRSPGTLTTSAMELLMAILKLTTSIWKILLKIALPSLLVNMLGLLLVKYDFFDILGNCFSRIKNYLLHSIIVVSSRIWDNLTHFLSPSLENKNKSTLSKNQNFLYLSKTKKILIFRKMELLSPKPKKNVK